MERNRGRGGAPLVAHRLEPVETFAQGHHRHDSDLCARSRSNPRPSVAPRSDPDAGELESTGEHFHLAVVSQFAASRVQPPAPRAERVDAVPGHACQRRRQRRSRGHDDVGIPRAMTFDFLHVTSADAVLRAIERIAAIGAIVSSLEWLAEPEKVRDTGIFSWQIMQLRHGWMTGGPIAGLLRVFYGYPGILVLFARRLACAVLLP